MEGHVGKIKKISLRREVSAEALRRVTFCLEKMVKADLVKAWSGEQGKVKGEWQSTLTRASPVLPQTGSHRLCHLLFTVSLSSLNFFFFPMCDLKTETKWLAWNHTGRWQWPNLMGLRHRSGQNEHWCWCVWGEGRDLQIKNLISVAHSGLFNLEAELVKIL